MVRLPPEKLGSFYLGAAYDVSNDTITSESVNYDSRDLTTHAVCVGMTGSGKTGLCIGLLEEAAIDKVPAIIIDPKGDMTNLLLQFEDLSPKDFKSWINPDDASRKGMTIDEYAKSRADIWQSGLAEWGQTKDRIKMLKESVDYCIYTPGSNSGMPINIMGSFAAPSVNFDSDAEMLRERIQGTVAALLGMIDSKEDPVRSREGILLSQIFEHFWRKDEDLDLAKLILSIQNPPMQKLGVFDIDTFFPEKDRFELAMSFNHLIASPQFQYWLQGDPLDIEKIYFTADGKPRHSIFYIAHLSESERMFFVTLLLNSLITWMRSQSGTTSLRSLLYFDEIFGYFPPTAQPPSKKPLLTILKQARAYGVGAILVTQNPVDIDYKGLSNAGTWFIGKLQTERDKMRVLDGLKGAIAEAGGAADLDFSQIISSLGSRVFLLHNVHADSPVVYHTRWAMSYLRGPLTRPQVKILMSDRKAHSAKQPESKTRLHGIVTPNKSGDVVDTADSRPSMDPAIIQKYFPVWKSANEAKRELDLDDELSLLYEPSILSIARVRYFDAKRGVDRVDDISLLSEAPDDFGRVEWDTALTLSPQQYELLEDPDHADNITVRYQDVPETANQAKEITKVKKSLSDWLYTNRDIEILEHDDFDLYSKDKESREAFMMRVQHIAREERDEELDELHEKYEVKFDRLRKKIRDEEQDIKEARADVKGRKAEEIIGVAETLLSVFIKRRRRSLSGAASKRRMRQKAAHKLEDAREDLHELHQDFDELELELKDKLAGVTEKWDKIADGVSSKLIKPRRTDVKVEGVMIAWLPYWVSSRGERTSALR